MRTEKTVATADDHRYTNISPEGLCRVITNRLGFASERVCRCTDLDSLTIIYAHTLDTGFLYGRVERAFFRILNYSNGQTTDNITRVTRYYYNCNFGIIIGKICENIGERDRTRNGPDPVQNTRQTEKYPTTYNVRT